MTARRELAVARDSPLMAAALGYAARGWPLFPCEPGGKRPLGRLVPHGLKDATTDPGKIHAWWRVEPEANVALVTGIHFAVLDIDGSEALLRLETWSESHPSHPGGDVEGPTVKTPRGWHVYVAPTGQRNTVNLGGLTGVDWRGRGGYVMAPPSIRDDGEIWQWITGSPVDLGPDTPIALAPPWVLSLFDRPKVYTVPGQAPVSQGTPYAIRALEAECGRLVMAPEGTRNDQLNRSAYAIGQLVGAGALSAQEAGAALLVAATRTGLGEQEATATIRSGMVSGIHNPRKVAS